MIAKKMPRADQLKLDKMNYYGQVLCGYYDFSCVVDENMARSAKFYIPEGSVYNQPTVFLLIPEKEDPYEFLVKSGWKKAADQNKIYIVILEPDESGKWGSREAESRYLSAMCEDVNYRPLFCAFASCFYAAAYGEAADVLLYQSLRNPKCWASVLLAGTAGISREEADQLNMTESKVKHVMLSQVQMPVWMVYQEENESVQRLITYYHKANQTDTEGTACEYADILYLPKGKGSMDEYFCAPVIGTKCRWTECLSDEFAEQVYEHLFHGRYRYAGNANGALRCHDDIEARGFRKFTGMVPGGYSDDLSDQYKRQWWVYTPQNISQDEKLPVVFVFHGAGGSGDEIADRSGWAQVAETERIMLVCPSASNENAVRRVSNITTNSMFRSRWNTGRAEKDFPNDIVFLDYLYRWVNEHYPVDQNRIYASGQSSGGMMTWACAAYRPDYFAAVAPVSAKDINKVSETLPPIPGTMVPIMANLGMEDRLFPGGFSTSEAKELIDYWCERYQLDHKWENYSFMGNGKNCSYEDGLFIHYVFSEKSGVPMLHCIETRTKTHAIWPSECRMIWDQWFSRFTKDKHTGTLYYQGKAVEV